jgi:hypothetical protein
VGFSENVKPGETVWTGRIKKEKKLLPGMTCLANIGGKEKLAI